MPTAQDTTRSETQLHPLDELVRDDRVHRSMYTDPEIFQREMERVFGATWTFVAHETEIPNKNDFVRKRLGQRPVIVTRDRDGEIHVIINRCTHRGATVCRVESGNARRFVCPYHNWTFENNGEVAAIPIDEAYGPALDRDALRLGRARVGVYRGFVFATLNPDMPSIEEHLGNAARYIDQWLDRWPGAKVVARSGSHRMLFKGNWKLCSDNSHDAYHAAYSHASLVRMRADRYGEGVDFQWFLGNIDHTPMTSNDLGNGNTFIDQRPVIESYWGSAAPMPGQQAYEKRIRERYDEDTAARALDVAIGSGMNLNIFPNLLFIGNQFQVVEPIDVNQTVINWYATTLEADDLPPEVNAIRMRVQEDFPNFGEPDDLANFEECHLGLASVPEMEWVNTSRHLTTGQAATDETGVVTGLVSDEQCIRAFWRRWKELMVDNTKLDVSGVAR